MRRRLGGALFAIALLAATCGCDTNQPAQGSAANAQVYFSGNVSSVAVYDVWDAKLVTLTYYLSTPTAPPSAASLSLGLWCDVPATVAEQSRIPIGYPFRYQVTIEKIPAGSPTPILLSDAVYEDDAALANITEYDATPLVPLGDHNGILVSDTVSTTLGTRTVVLVELTNGRRVSTASREFLIYPKIAQAAVPSYGSKCPIGGFGNASSANAFPQAAVAGSSPSFGVELATGDTIVVRAKKDESPMTWVLYNSQSPPAFSSTLFVDGRDVSRTVLGRTDSGALTDEAIAYSYTQR